MDFEFLYEEMNDTSTDIYEQKQMNLLVTIDKNYISPLCTMLASYAAQHKGIRTDVYVAHNSLDDEDIARVEKAAEGADIHIHSVKINEGWFRDTPVIERLPEESFYRIMAFSFLPEEVEKCLYLDPDIYIQKSLLPLYEMDMGNNYLAAASHLNGPVNIFNRLRLGLDKQPRYINSGVMLMNLAQIRSSFTIEKVLSCLEENIQILFLGDQDLINILFGSRTILIDERVYNLDERTFRRRRGEIDIEWVKNETAIIHYNGKYKPWLNGYKGELDCLYPQTGEKGSSPKGRGKAQAKAIHNIVKATPRQKAVLCVGALLLLAIVLYYVFFGNEIIKLVADPVLFRQWLDSFGPFDEIVFILIRAAQTVVKFIPAEPLEIASGYAWGAVLGMIYCLIGNIIGSLAILALTRRFGQKIITHFLPARNLKALELFRSSDKTYAMIFVLFVIPGSPKDGFTYLAALLPIKTVPFLIVTSIARIPSIISSTLCGATIAEKQYWVSAVIFIATILLSLLGAAVYRAIIRKRTTA